MGTISDVDVSPPFVLSPVGALAPVFWEEGKKKHRCPWSLPPWVAVFEY